MQKWKWHFPAFLRKWSTVYRCSISGLLWQNCDGHLKLNFNQFKAMCLGEICMCMAIKSHWGLQRWSTIRLECVICARTSHQILKALRNFLSLTPESTSCLKTVRTEQEYLFGVLKCQCFNILEVVALLNT